MISITIVGILAAIAIPNYQDYTIRAKVSEALNLTGAMKLAVSEYYIANGNLPADATQAGIDNISTDYVASTAYTGNDTTGDIIITLGEDINPAVNGKKMMLRVTVVNGFLDWDCKSADEDGLAAKFLPASCR